MVLFVDDAQMERRCLPTLDLGVINKSTNNDSARIPFRLIPGAFLPGHSWNDSGGILIPFEIPPESLIVLAGPSAKFDSSGIPGIAWIPAGISGGQ